MTETWREYAACRHHNPNLWFPSTVGTSAMSARAKAICRDCPVQADCLTHALSADERWGIWGGLGEDERDAIRRGKARA